MTFSRLFQSCMVVLLVFTVSIAFADSADQPVLLDSDEMQIRRQAAEKVNTRETSVRPEYAPFEVSSIVHDGEWAFLNLTSYPLVADAEKIERLHGNFPDIMLAVAHKQDGEWVLFLETELEYRMILSQLPASVLSTQSRAILYNSPTRGEERRVPTSVTIPGLPWAVNQSWRYNQSPHGGSQDAYDFGTPQYGSDSVHAADDGVVVYVNPNSADTCVAFQRSDGLRLWYQHIRRTDTVNWSIGESIAYKDPVGFTTTASGEMGGCAGSSGGHHVHFYFDYANSPVDSEGSTMNDWLASGTQLIRDGVVVSANFTDRLEHREANIVTCESPNTTFCDIPTNHPRYDAIQALFDAGLIQGRTTTIDGVQRRFYDPDEPILRQHVAIIVAHWMYQYSSADGFALLPPPTNVFNDMSGDGEIIRAAEMLFRDGIVNGFSDDTFRPLNNATRQDLIYMVMQPLLKHQGTGSVTCSYNDTTDPVIRKACDLGLVIDQANFSPDDPIARDLAALVICRAFLNACTTGSSELATLKANAREQRTNDYLCFTADRDAQQEGHIPGVTVNPDGMVASYVYSSGSYQVGCGSSGSGQADLVIDRLEVTNRDTGETLSDGATVSNLTDLRIRSYHKNCGGTDVSADFTLEYRDNGTLLGDDIETSSLDADCLETKDETITFDISGSGLHTFEVCLDTTNIVAESDENNNCATFQLNVSGSPGKNIEISLFRVTNSSNQLIRDGDTVASGTRLGLRVEMINCGSEEITEDFVVEYRHNGALIDDDIESSTVVPDCSSDERETDAFTLTGSGSHTVSVCVDTTNVVDEYNENDNCASQTVNIGTPTPPLIVGRVQATNNRATFVPGETVSLGIEASNNYLATTSTLWDWEVRDSAGNVLSSMSQLDTPIDMAHGDTEHEYGTTVPQSAAAGIYTFIGRVRAADGSVSAENSVTFTVNVPTAITFSNLTISDQLSPIMLSMLLIGLMTALSLFHTRGSTFPKDRTS